MKHETTHDGDGVAAYKQMTTTTPNTSNKDTHNYFGNIGLNFYLKRFIVFI
jgi:hypothetical protein